ncbi:DUF1007 family protein [Morganella morganii]
MLILKVKSFYRKTFSVFAVFITLLVSSIAIAHPHRFIGLETTFDIQNDKLVGLTFLWKMDPVASADILYELKNVKPESDIWKKQATVLMENVLSHSYFSELYVDGEKQQFRSMPESYSLKKEKLQLIFSFQVLLMNPVHFAARQFELLTYDPTFYTSMTYSESSKITLPLEMAAGCRLKLVEPFASYDLKKYAKSLDINGLVDENLNLGLSFAQRVQVFCE